MATILTVKDLLAVNPGDRENPSWVNGVFSGIVMYGKAGSGNRPGSCVLKGGDGSTIEGVVWQLDPSQWNGKQIKVSGKGITRGEYKGKQNVSFGDKAKVEVIGTPADASAPVPSQRPETPKSTETAEERVQKWFQLYDAVCRESAGKTQEREALTPAEHTSITTAIWLSFRGDYGAYAPPFFRAAQQPRPQSGQNYGESYHNGLDRGEDVDTDAIPF